MGYQALPALVVLTGDFLQVMCIAAKVKHLVSACGTCRVASKTPLPSFHLRAALSDTPTGGQAQRYFPRQTVQHDSDLLLRWILFVRGLFSVFDDLFARASRVPIGCLMPTLQWLR